jgi:hypothetical protein
MLLSFDYGLVLPGLKILQAPLDRLALGDFLLL